MPTLPKLLALLILPVLLAACGGSAQPTADTAAPDATATDAAAADTSVTDATTSDMAAAENTDSAATTPAAETPLDDTAFVAISAEIVCLVQGNQGANPTQMEAQAQAIVARHGSSQADYEAYQKNMTPDTRKALSLAVIGKAGELCNFGNNAGASATPAPAATAAPLSATPATTPVPLPLGSTPAPAAAPLGTAAPLQLGN